MNKKILFKSALKYLPLLLIISVIASFPFLGADCSKLVNGQVSQKSYFYHTWMLKRQTGNLIDVCPGEIVIFGQGNDVRLMCMPYIDTVFREYEINESERTVTFKPSMVAYNWAFKDSSGVLCLNLYGINVGRNLFYQELILNAGNDTSLTVGDEKSNCSEFINKSFKKPN
jgi:hypothetical protein